MSQASDQTSVKKTIKINNLFYIDDVFIITFSQLNKFELICIDYKIGVPVSILKILHRQVRTSAITSLFCFRDV